jgi:U6 snRNA-associated Sm-like protein LSm8
MAAMLEEMVDKVVQVITNDGRNIVGVLKGFDQTTNIILEECHERVFSSDAGVEQVVLGLYIVRGDNMCAPAASIPPVLTPFFVADSESPCSCAVRRSAVVGEVDEDADAELSLDEIMAEPLKPVTH